MRKKKQLIDLYVADNNKDTVLHMAARASNITLLKAFIQEDKEDSNWVNKENASGMTPLDIATKQFRQTLGTISPKHREKGAQKKLVNINQRCYEIIHNHTLKTGKAKIRETAIAADVFKSFEEKDDRKNLSPDRNINLHAFAQKKKKEEDHSEKEKSSEEEDNGEDEEDEEHIGGEDVRGDFVLEVEDDEENYDDDDEENYDDEEGDDEDEY